MTRHYVMPADALGQRAVITSPGQPVDMTGVNVVELPSGDWLRVKGRDKEYPASNVARAIVAGQILLTDVEVSK